jgi:hypothetical protein
VTSFLRRISQLLGRWPIALATCFVLAAIVLLPALGGRLGGPGLWEPQERQLSDRVAPPLDSPAATKPVTPPPAPAPAPADDDCQRVAPKDAIARSLTARAIELGRDSFGDDDGGRRLPLALLGLLTVLAAAGTAIRIGGARAGIVTTVVLLAMPLLSLQARMLTSEIGTACGASLIVFALVGLARPARAAPRWRALDATLCSIALLAGLALAFCGGGALLGLLVPIGAFAAAGSLGVPLITNAIKGRLALSHLPALLAALAAAALIGVLAYQLYDLHELSAKLPPQSREVFGHAVVPNGCWSSALGAIWRPEDDLRVIYDSSFEQIAYGTFPWGVLAPIAMFGLLRSADRGHRMIGAVTLAWAAAAWLASEAFQRKVGFTIWAGFPALAIAIGVWLDSLLVRRASGDRDAMPSGAILIALFVGLAVLDLGKDMQSFAEKLTSLFVSDSIAYPTQAHLLGVSTKLWVLVLGLVAGVGFAMSLGLWRTGDDPTGRLLRKLANIATIVALGFTIVLAAFWTFLWQPGLAVHLSSKQLFDTYNEVRDLSKDAPSVEYRNAVPPRHDPLVIMGDLGQAPHFYTDVKPEPAPSREQIVAALKRPSSVFAIAPQTELCPLHREMAEKPYFVLDDRNARNLLLSNRIDGAEDRNPLASMIVHQPPSPIRYRPKSRVVFDKKIELLGWDLPQKIDRGDQFEVITYFKILCPEREGAAPGVVVPDDKCTSVGGAWTMLMHFDGPLRLRDGDHKPIKDRCPTSTWRVGDYIIDRHTMSTSGGSFPAGRYELWIGFFTGTSPNFRNMPVTTAPADMRDTVDRVKITSITLE